MFKNMKIEINEQQPLDEVVKELERLGFRWCVDTKHNYSTKCIVTFTNGLFDFFYGGWRQYDLTTLAELKDMPLNDFCFDFKQQPSNTVELGMQMLEEGVK